MSGTEEEPPAERRNKIDITVAGHVVVVDSDASLAEVEATAMRLFEWSADYAKRAPFGFAIPPPNVERFPEEL